MNFINIWYYLFIYLSIYRFCDLAELTWWNRRDWSIETSKNELNFIRFIVWLKDWRRDGLTEWKKIDWRGDWFSDRRLDWITEDAWIDCLRDGLLDWRKAGLNGSWFIYWLKEGRMVWMQEKGEVAAWKAVTMHNFVSCLWLHSKSGYCWWLLATLNESCTSSTHITA